MPFRTPGESAKLKAASRGLRERLAGEGYTVNGDMKTWRVYVVELLPPEKQDPKHKPAGYLYVGQTSISVEERARQHELGPSYPWKGRQTHSRPCHKQFKVLRLDMLPAAFTGPLYSEELALNAESMLRLYFESLGYEVIGGQERYPKGREA